MRRKTAKEILLESFRELAERKPIDKVTVKEITTNCGYSTATFYRQFKDKYDLITWGYRGDLEEILDRHMVEGADYRQIFLAVANYYSEHREYLANLLLHTGGYDSFIYNMTEINSWTLTRIIRSAGGESALNEETEMLIRIYVSGSVQLTCDWILGKYAAGPEILTEVFHLALPEALKQRL